MLPVVAVVEEPVAGVAVDVAVAWPAVAEGLVVACSAVVSMPVVVLLALDLPVVGCFAVAWLVGWEQPERVAIAVSQTDFVFY